MKIEHGTKETEEYVYVIQGMGPTLLGRDIISKLQLDWSIVYRTDCVEGTDSTNVPATLDAPTVESLKKKYR